MGKKLGLCGGNETWRDSSCDLHIILERFAIQHCLFPENTVCFRLEFLGEWCRAKLQIAFTLVEGLRIGQFGNCSGALGYQ
jgi:hypothetical protein